MKPGDRLADRYALVERIGEGGMGEVWRGEQVVLKRAVAIKVIHSEKSESLPELRERFQREAELAAKVEHRNVIDIIDYGVTSSGDQFLVMPLLEGETLHQRLRRAPPPSTAEVLGWVRAILAGLAAIHDAKIVHRDLKPGNVFLARDADGIVPKLLDFGISRTAEPSGTGITQLGTAIGTPQYMAPEQFESARDVDARADLYSVGAMLYEAFAGRPPVEGPDAFAIYRKVLQSEPARLCDVRLDLPAPLGAMVDRAIAKDPDDRFTSAREMRDAIDALVATGALPGVSPGTWLENGTPTPNPDLGTAPTTPAADAVRDAAKTPERPRRVPATAAMDGEPPVSGDAATVAAHTPDGTREAAPKIRTPATSKRGTAALVIAGLLVTTGGVAAWMLTRAPGEPPTRPPAAPSIVEPTPEVADPPTVDPSEATPVGTEREPGGFRVAGPAALGLLAMRYAHLAPGDRRAPARFVPDRGEWSIVLDRDAGASEASRIAELFGGEASPTPLDPGHGLTPSLVRTTARLSVHAEPAVDAPTTRVLPEGGLGVALDGDVGGQPSPGEGESGLRYLAVARETVGWSVARYLEPERGCLPRVAAFVRAAPDMATAIRRDATVARTPLDVGGRHLDAYVMAARIPDGSSLVAAFEAGDDCEAGTQLAVRRIDGVIDEHFVTDTARVGGRSLLVVSWSSGPAPPSDGVLEWAAYDVASAERPVWSASLPTAAFLGRRGAFVNGSRDRILESHPGYALTVRPPDGPRLYYRWDDDAHRLVAADAP